MTTRFTDNENGTINDTKTGLTWAKEDSWQAETKWVTWDEGKEHAQHLNNIKLAGRQDWRLPNLEEAKSIYEPDQKNEDKYGSTLYLDPIFPSGCLPTIWLDEGIPGNDGSILDFRNGEVRPLYKSKTGRMAVRPVCGE